MQLSFSTTGRTDKQALVFLHGFLGRGEDWREIIDQAAETRCCIAPDLPGHGESTTTEPDDYTFARTARSVVAILDRLQIETATLVGYSLGGRIALYTALEYPRRITGLVLESASPGLASARERAARAAEDRERAARVRRQDLGQFVDAWYAMPLFASLHRNPDRLALLKQRRRRNQPDGLALSLENAGTGVMPSLWSRLGELAIPVLLVCGELDDKFVRINTTMTETLARPRLQVVAGAGHNVHLENPAALNRALNGFLAEAIG